LIIKTRDGKASNYLFLPTVECTLARVIVRKWYGSGIGHDDLSEHTQRGIQRVFVEGGKECGVVFGAYAVDEVEECRRRGTLG